MQELHTILQPGTVIQRRYAVEDVPGKGSSGAVNLVRDLRGKRNLFVLKEVARPGSKEGHQIAFASRLFKRLDHPALPGVYQVFKDGRRGPVYMLMEYIEGPDVEILQQGQPERRFSLSQAISLIAPIMRAVTYLHGQRYPIIHGDIKPSNIIVRKENAAPVLVGFSLVEEDDTGSIATAVHGYRAPEQYSGKIDPRTDIYALGAVLYTLLSGTVPADALNRLTQFGMKEPDPLLPLKQILPDVAPTIASAIHRAMSIRINDRYSTVEQFWNGLWQEPIFNPLVQVQHTWEPVAAPPAEGNGESDSNPEIPQMSEHIITATIEENLELDANPAIPQIAEPEVTMPEMEMPTPNAEPTEWT